MSHHAASWRPPRRRRPRRRRRRRRPRRRVRWKGRRGTGTSTKRFSVRRRATMGPRAGRQMYSDAGPGFRACAPKMSSKFSRQSSVNRRVWCASCGQPAPHAEQEQECAGTRARFSTPGLGVASGARGGSSEVSVWCRSAAGRRGRQGCAVPVGEADCRWRRPCVRRARPASRSAPVPICTTRAPVSISTPLAPVRGAPRRG